MAAPRGWWGALTSAALARAAASPAVQTGDVGPESTPLALAPGEGAVRLPAAQPDHQPIAPPPLAAAVLAPAVAVPADAPVPIHPRAHWPVALRASAYSLVYRMSYGRGAYRFAARHGATARTAMGHALRKNRPGARPAGRAAHARAWAGGFSGG